MVHGSRSEIIPHDFTSNKDTYPIISWVNVPSFDIFDEFILPILHRLKTFSAAMSLDLPISLCMKFLDDSHGPGLAVIIKASPSPCRGRCQKICAWTCFNTGKKAMFQQKAMASWILQGFAEWPISADRKSQLITWKNNCLDAMCGGYRSFIRLRTFETHFNCTLANIPKQNSLLGSAWRIFRELKITHMLNHWI